MESLGAPNLLAALFAKGPPSKSVVVSKADILSKPKPGQSSEKASPRMASIEASAAKKTEPSEKRSEKKRREGS